MYTYSFGWYCFCLLVLTSLRKKLLFFPDGLCIILADIFVKNGCHGWWVKYALLMLKYSLSHDLQIIKLRYFSAWLRVVHCISSCQQKKLTLGFLSILIKDTQLEAFRGVPFQVSYSFESLTGRQESKPYGSIDRSLTIISRLMTYFLEWLMDGAKHVGVLMSII